MLEYRYRLEGTKAAAMMYLGNVREAFTLLQSVLQQQEQLYPEECFAVAVTLNNMGRMAVQLKRDEAEEIYQRCISLKENLLGKYHSSTLTTKMVPPQSISPPLLCAMRPSVFHVLGKDVIPCSLRPLPRRTWLPFGWSESRTKYEQH